MQGSGYNYCYLTLRILFKSIHSQAHNQIVPTIVKLYKWLSFCIHLNGFK